jgi:hypothetical protein
MRTRARWLAALLAAALTIPALAEAGTRRPVDITQTIAALSTERGVVRTAGANEGTFGRGAVRGRTTVRRGVYRTVYTNYYPRGTIRAVSDLTRRDEPDGSTSYTGTGRFTGGTGRFEGARGSFRVTATVPPQSIVGTFRMRGSIRF